MANGFEIPLSGGTHRLDRNERTLVYVDRGKRKFRLLRGLIVAGPLALGALGALAVSIRRRRPAPM